MQPRLLPALCALAVTLAVVTADESAPVGEKPELAEKPVSEPSQETAEVINSKAPPSAVPDYKFLYEVHDPDTGDIKGQKESRYGVKVQGEYVVTEADGTLRTVEYAADKHSGFSAVVKKSGPHKHITSVSHANGGGGSGGVGDHRGEGHKHSGEEGGKTRAGAGSKTWAQAGEGKTWAGVGAGKTWAEAGASKTGAVEGSKTWAEATEGKTGAGAGSKTWPETGHGKTGAEVGGRTWGEYGGYKVREKSRYAMMMRGKSRGYKKAEKQEQPTKERKVSGSQMSFELLSDSARPSSEVSPPATSPVNFRIGSSSEVTTPVAHPVSFNDGQSRESSAPAENPVNHNIPQSSEISPPATSLSNFNMEQSAEVSPPAANPVNYQSGQSSEVSLQATNPVDYQTGQSGEVSPQATNPFDYKIGQARVVRPPATNSANYKTGRESKIRSGRGQRGYKRGKVVSGGDALEDQGRFELLSEIGQNGQSGLDGKEEEGSLGTGSKSSIIGGQRGRVEYDVFINHADKQGSAPKTKINLTQVSPPGNLKIIVGDVAPLFETSPLKFPTTSSNPNGQIVQGGQGGLSSQEEVAGQNGISGQGDQSSPKGQGGVNGQSSQKDQGGFSGGVREQGGFRPLGYAGAGFSGQRPLSQPIVVANPPHLGGRGSFSGLGSVPGNGFPNQGVLRGNVGGQGINEVIKIISRPNIQSSPNNFGGQLIVGLPGGFGGLGGIAHIPGFGNVRDLIAQEGLAGQVIRGTRNPTSGQQNRGQGRVLGQKRPPPYMIIRGVVRTHTDD